MEPRHQMFEGCAQVLFNRAFRHTYPGSDLGLIEAIELVQPKDPLCFIRQFLDGGLHERDLLAIADHGFGGRRIGNGLHTNTVGRCVKPLTFTAQGARLPAYHIQPDILSCAKEKGRLILDVVAFRQGGDLKVKLLKNILGDRGVTGPRHEIAQDHGALFKVSREQRRRRFGTQDR